MKGRFLIGFVFVGMLLVQSCSKTQVEIPESNDPVFLIEGSFAGESFSLVAGDDNAYMFTNTYVVNGVNFYSGNISNGNFSVELGVYDGMLDIPNHQPQVELSNLNPIFAQHTPPPIATLSKDLFANTQYISQIIWKVDGVQVGIDQAVIHEPGLYDVCADITFLGGQTATLCNELILGYERSSNCSINFSTGGGYLNADVSNVTGIGVDDVVWFIDDVEVGTGISAQLPITGGMKKLSADVYFSNGAVRRKNALVNPASSVQNTDDFTIFESNSSNAPTRDFNLSMKIEKDGQTFLSEFADNDDGEITIIEVTYYGKNSNNKDVYKIKASIEAVVESISTQKQLPVSFTTTFGIEIP